MEEGGAGVEAEGVVVDAVEAVAMDLLLKSRFPGSSTMKRDDNDLH